MQKKICCCVRIRTNLYVGSIKSFPSVHAVVQCVKSSKEVLAYAMKICLEGTRHKNLKM